MWGEKYGKTCQFMSNFLFFSRSAEIIFINLHPCNTILFLQKKITSKTKKGKKENTIIIRLKFIFRIESKEISGFYNRVKMEKERKLGAKES